MPVTDISVKRLVRLIGPKARKKAVLDVLPYLGLDIESEDGDTIRAEYSPNRPDYSTDYGIAEGLCGLLGIRVGAQKILAKPAKYKIHISPKMSKIRPAIVAVLAQGITLNEGGLKQLIAMQEDLHAGIGRHRRIASIGIHDADSIKFPLRYEPASRDTEFVPLGSKRALTVDAMLKETDVGIKYGPLVASHADVPMLYDDSSRILSFPPVINSTHTALTTATRKILVEITGTHPEALRDIMSTISATLISAGAQLYEVKTKHKPLNVPRKMMLSPALVRDTLGLELKTPKIIACLKRSRLDATKSGSRISCTIPPHRFDILGEMDLVEEVALGYGIDKIEPLLPPQESSGQVSAQSAMLDGVSRCMMGLGYTEALNSSLASAPSLEGLVRSDTAKLLSVAESKSHSNTVLRDSLIPGLFEVLSRNVHEPYPQNIYEIGTVFGRARPVDERIMVAAATTHKGTSYTQAKSVAVAMLRQCFGASPATVASSHAALKEGHTANIMIKGRRVGIIGLASDATLERLKLRQPVAVFEVDLSAVSSMR